MVHTRHVAADPRTAAPLIQTDHHAQLVLGQPRKLARLTQAHTETARRLCGFLDHLTMVATSLVSRIRVSPNPLFEFRWGCYLDCANCEFLIRAGWFGFRLDQVQCPT